MEESKYLLDVCKELTINAQKIDKEELLTACQSILRVNHIFVAGVGRSGFVARAFANRLMHLGLKVSFVGEATTPAIQKDDLLFIISGSGETDSLKNMAQKAFNIEVDILLLTIHPGSSIGKLADACIVIPGATPKSGLQNTCVTIQPLGSAFEQMSWIVCDVIVMYLMDFMRKTEEEMFCFHANLE